MLAILGPIHCYGNKDQLTRGREVSTFYRLRQQASDGRGRGVHPWRLNRTGRRWNHCNQWTRSGGWGLRDGRGNRQPQGYWCERGMSLSPFLCPTRSRLNAVCTPTYLGRSEIAPLEAFWVRERVRCTCRGLGSGSGGKGARRRSGASLMPQRRTRRANASTAARARLLIRTAMWRRSAGRAGEGPFILYNCPLLQFTQSNRGAAWPLAAGRQRATPKKSFICPAISSWNWHQLPARLRARPVRCCSLDPSWCPS